MYAKHIIRKTARERTQHRHPQAQISVLVPFSGTHHLSPMNIVTEITTMAIRGRKGPRVTASADSISDPKVRVMGLTGLDEIRIRVTARTTSSNPIQTHNHNHLRVGPKNSARLGGTLTLFCSSDSVTILIIRTCRIGRIRFL